MENTTANQPTAATTASPSQAITNTNTNTGVTPSTNTNTNTGLSSLLSPSWIYPTMVNVDVHEEKDNFKITAELPGVSRNDICVSVDDGYLTISGHKKEEKEEEMKQDDEDSNTTTSATAPSSSPSSSSSSSSSSPSRVCRRSERRYGSFERSFRLPVNCEVDDQLSNVNAKYDNNNGVLTITIPKMTKQLQQEKQRKNIQIQ